MEEKLTMKEFTDDIYLVLKKGIQYDEREAWEQIKIAFVEKLG